VALQEKCAELESLWKHAEHRSDGWRGIASAMGYEPNAHDKVKPQAQWILDRVARFRAQVTDSAVLAAIQTERARCAEVAESYQYSIGFGPEAKGWDSAAEYIADEIRKEPT
jgi:hypothetical protein